jgi:hypothetical protein
MQEKLGTKYNFCSGISVTSQQFSGFSFTFGHAAYFEPEKAGAVVKITGFKHFPKLFSMTDPHQI